MAINLGDIVADRISGFAGIATARTEYLYRSDVIEITPRDLMKEGGLAKSQWFNIDQVINNEGPGTTGFQSTTSPPVEGAET